MRGPWGTSRSLPLSRYLDNGNYAEDVVMPTLHKEALACADGVGRSSA